MERKLEAVNRKSEEARMKAKKMRRQRDARPNSVSACIKFIFRRIFGRR